jgi:hypothetical protein
MNHPSKRPKKDKNFLDKRWEAIENGTAILVDWEKLKKGLFKKYGKAKS